MDQQGTNLPYSPLYQLAFKYFTEKVRFGTAVAPVDVCVLLARVAARSHPCVSFAPSAGPKRGAQATAPSHRPPAASTTRENHVLRFSC